MTDNFNGDTPHLIRCIEALLNLDGAGALVPHRLPGHARTLLEAAAVRLAAVGVQAPDAALPFDRWPKPARDGYEALEKHLEQGPSFPLALLMQIRVALADGVDTSRGGQQ